jgi:hypothetical protein
MNPTAQVYDFATQILASKEFFERSTRVLEENDSEFRPRDEMMTVAQQVAHTAQTLEWFLNGATQPEGFDLNFEEQAKALVGVTSLAMAYKRLDAAFTRAVDFLRSRKPEELAHPLPPGPVWVVNRSAISCGQWWNTPRITAAHSLSMRGCSGRCRRCHTAVRSIRPKAQAALDAYDSTSR